MKSIWARLLATSLLKKPQLSGPESAQSLRHNYLKLWMSFTAVVRRLACVRLSLVHKPNRESATFREMDNAKSRSQQRMTLTTLFDSVCAGDIKSIMLWSRSRLLKSYANAVLIFPRRQLFPDCKRLPTGDGSSYGTDHRRFCSTARIIQRQLRL